MSTGCHPPQRNGKAFALATGLLALLILGLLAQVAATRRGNLAWDDADYLRRGLANARESGVTGGLSGVLRALELLLHEQPKPPWLVAWIQAGTLVFDRHRLGGLIVHAAVVPYACLLVAVAALGRRFQGARGSLAAVICLVASPASLAFGAKVMVETFLSLWIFLTYVLTCHLLAQPSRRRGAALGLSVGLALLTKLTTVLFLPAPLYFVLARVARGGPDRRVLVKSLAWSAVVCAAVAGPWYAANAGRAIQFARFSSRYNETVEGRLDRDPRPLRLVKMTRDLAGWPLTATLACGTLWFMVSTAHGFNKKGSGTVAGTAGRVLCTTVGFKKGSGTVAGTAGRVLRTTVPDPFLNPFLNPEPSTTFSRMAWLGALIAAGILLYPGYFDTRFLLPIWPVIAVDLGRRCSVMLPRLERVPRIILAGGLTASLIAACIAVVRVPTIPTYWKTSDLIDALVREHGISNLGNLGNCAEWNVCKTGLINELRDQPASCFVLHDLSRSQPEVARRRLARFDAVVVLGEDHLRASSPAWAPGLNRSYAAIAQALAQDPAFVRVMLPRAPGLPQLSVYLRSHSRSGAQQASRTPAGVRRL